MSKDKLFWECPDCASENEFPGCRKCETCGYVLSDEAFTEWENILKKRAEKEALEKREAERVRKEKEAEERRRKEAEERRRKEAEERRRKEAEERSRREAEERRRIEAEEYRSRKIKSRVIREMRFGKFVRRVLSIVLATYLILTVLGLLISALDRWIGTEGFFYKIHTFLLRHNFYERMIGASNTIVFLLIGFLSVYCIVLSAIQRKADKIGHEGFGVDMDVGRYVISYNNTLVLSCLVFIPIGALISTLTLQLDWESERFLEHFLTLVLFEEDGGAFNMVDYAQQVLGSSFPIFGRLFGTDVNSTWFVLAVFAIVCTIIAACFKPRKKTNSFMGFIFPGIYIVTNLVYPYVSIVLVYLLGIIDAILEFIIGIFH